MRTVRVRITGLVQGVGFRPFVAELAEALQISGWVKNSGGIVTTELTGSDEAVDEWFHRLYHFTPEGARIDGVEVTELDERTEVSGGNPVYGQGASEISSQADGTGFFIVDSTREEEELRFLPPDLPVCETCERELFDPSNRRFCHPFISCTACGPRYSILRAVPYDRENITMERFPMCSECASEYTERGNRRRHAQTIACHSCGPLLRAFWMGETAISENSSAAGIMFPGRNGADEGTLPAGQNEGEEAVRQAISVLQGGGVIALKDIGGYHFACLAEDETAVRRLREFKQRDTKPFAVMFPDMERIREYCRVSSVEEELLGSPARPIVLLHRIKSLPEPVCGISSRIGAMLPCNPLQILLLRECAPLVMTSGNRGGEPIIIDDDRMLRLVRDGFPDLVLSHDREILEPLEDSIYQVTDMESDGMSTVDHVVQLIRRARGLVPEPVLLARRFRAPVFAAGGDLKAAFAYGKGNAAYLSSYFGDLAHPEAAAARENAIGRMGELLAIKPQMVLCDAHPNYISSRSLEEFSKLPEQRIWHHHAHIAGVMAEYGLEGPVLGLAFDGTGYGMDGTIWGGEFLLCEEADCQRMGALYPIAMPAGDQTARDAWIPALSYLDAAVERGLITSGEVTGWIGGRQAGRLKILHAARKNGAGQILSSSMGRLFDAAAALLGICAQNGYEGECAVRMEEAAKAAKECYPLKLPLLQKADGVLCADGAALLASLLRAAHGGADIGALARGFHRAVAMMTVEMSRRLCGDSIRQIALAGGTWYNQLLLQGVIPPLREAGFEVFVNRRVPSGDGGLALGQLWFSAITKI